MAVGVLFQGCMLVMDLLVVLKTLSLVKSLEKVALDFH